MTQSVVVQVGQCGNQVGCRFWDLALREHAHVNKIMYLGSANNNKASTALGFFMSSVEKFGFPLRVRGDQGVENVGIAQYMFTIRGCGRASYISGKSVHNQRVERLWRDMWMAVTRVYYELLHGLEEECLLDPSNSLQLFCAQFIFVPRLQMDLDTFTAGWDNHPLRTEQNLTPNQLWTIGFLQYPVAAPENLEKGLYDEALSSFFRNVDSRKSDGGACVVGGRIQHLKARAVLVDMEEGVVNEILQGPLREVFDSTQLLTDVSGSGNNWAVGHMTYGSAYREQIVDKLRKAAEHCDCLQCFFLIHSMGGGTGSGLGTRVLSLLEEEFPEVCRIVTSIYPSAEDDVITSPYNSVLAMRELTEHADCVLPVENQSLVDIVNKIKQMSHGGKPGSVIKRDSTIISGQGGLSGAEKPFDAMNNIVANLLLNITSSARFEGSLNMDLNEVAMNLVPFPRLHYLVPSLTPLYTLADVSIPTRRLDQMFSDAFSKDHQLIRADPKHSLYLACALMVRGNVQVSDLRRNIERLKPSLPFVSWNQEGWKTGLCSVPPVGHSHSLLALANNTCVKPTFMELRERFTKLYRKKAHLHHYLHVEGMEQSFFSEAISSLSSLIEEYHQLDATKGRLMPDAPRLCIAR